MQVHGGFQVVQFLIECVRYLSEPPHGHPTATRSYAWSYETDEGKQRDVAVLHHWSVESPEVAVRAAIVQDIEAEWRNNDSA